MKNVYHKFTLKTRIGILPQLQLLLKINLLQSMTLKLLKQRNNIIIKPTDKNLGPAAMDKDTYIMQTLTEHLLTKHYTKLTKQEAYGRLDHQNIFLKDYITSNQHGLISFPDPQNTTLDTQLLWTIQGPLSSSNCLLLVFSTWLDYKMKEQLPLVSSYTKN